MFSRAASKSIAVPVSGASKQQKIVDLDLGMTL